MSFVDPHIQFSNDGISPSYHSTNTYYSVHDLIVDTRDNIATFWIEGKRLTKFLNRDSDYNLMQFDYSEGSLKEVSSIEKISDPLFIIYDDLNKNFGHFFIDNFPRMWYYDTLKLEHFAKIGIVFPIDKQYDPRHILNIKYENKIITLNKGKVYLIKEAIIPGFYFWWIDPLLPERFFRFIETYFSDIGNTPTAFDSFYLSRRDVENCGKRRVLMNEQELINRLEEHSIVSKTLIGISIEDTLRFFKNKRHVIGLEGAGLNYAMLASPNTKISVIVHPKIKIFTSWFTEIQKYKPMTLNFIHPEIEFHGDGFNDSWRIRNIDKVVEQILL